MAKESFDRSKPHVEIGTIGETRKTSKINSILALSMLSMVSGSTKLFQDIEARPKVSSKPKFNEGELERLSLLYGKEKRYYVKELLEKYK